MKIYYYLFILIVLSSCKDDISKSEFRNADYLFYQEEGEKGIWQKIGPNSTFKYKKGKLTYFYNNSNVFGEIEIIDSFPNRISKYYDKNGALVKTYWRKNDSIIKEYLENGFLTHNYTPLGPVIEKGLVENNLRQGIWQYYRKGDGSLKRITEMKNGIEHGKNENYWENGNLKNSSYWNMGKEIGEGIIYHENGNIDEKHFIKNGEIHGKIEQFYPDGTLKFRANSWYGVVKDTSRFYYENGALKKLTIVTIDTNTKTTIGKEYTYFQNGILKIESDVKNGLTNGIITRYYPNGNIKERIESIMDNFIGNYTTYFESGVKKNEGNVHNGFYNGKVNYYNEIGDLLKTVDYNNGIALDSIMY